MKEGMGDPQQLAARSRGLRSWSAAAMAALALWAVSPHLRGQDATFERDIQFVRDLRALDFSELAWAEFERLGQGELSASRAQRIAQLEVDLLVRDARSCGDLEERRMLYSAALARASRLAQDGSSPPAPWAAHIRVADVAIEVIGWLAHEVDAAGEEDASSQGLRHLVALRADRQTTLLTGLAACDAAIHAAGRDASATKVKNLARLRRGVLHGMAARSPVMIPMGGAGLGLPTGRVIVPALMNDPGVLKERAVEELENLALSVGENTILGLAALLERASVMAAASSDEGVEAYEIVVGETQSFDWYAEGSGIVGSAVMDIMQHAHERIAAMHFAAGRHAEVLGTTVQFQRRLDDMGVPRIDLLKPVAVEGGEGLSGLLLYVTYARACAASGRGVDAALRLVHFLSERYPDDIVGLRARAAMAEMLRWMPGKQVARVMLLASRGALEGRFFDDAVKFAKRALTAADVDDSIGLAAHGAMADAMMGSLRFLEATLALQHGIDLHAAGAGPDACRALAGSLVHAVQGLRAQTRHDPFFDDLVAEAFEAIRRHGVPDADALQGHEIMRRTADRQRPRAIEALGQIGADSSLHSLARLRMAFMMWFAGDADSARVALDQCRRGLVDTTPPVTVAGGIDFLEAFLLHDQASELGAEDGVGLQRRIVDLLAPFENRYGQALAGWLPDVRCLLGEAYLATGNVVAARSQLDRLQDQEPKLGSACLLAVMIFSALVADATGPAEAGVGSTSLRDRQRAAATFGAACAQKYASWPFSCWLLTLQLLDAIGDWPGVEDHGSELSTRDLEPAEQAEVAREVLPMLGHALLQQKKFQQAHEVLVRAEAAAPGNYPVKRLLCLALGGWTEINRLGRVQREPGLGRAVEAYLKYASEYRIYGLNRDRGVEPFGVEWFEFHWECYAFALAAGEVEPRFHDRARELYDTVLQVGFSEVERLGPRGAEVVRCFRSSPPPTR